jgi:hypothetical protein
MTTPTSGWARAFAVASRVRGERAIHAKGSTFTGTVQVSGGLDLELPLLDEPARFDAVVRFSRAIGLPDALPDFLGLAVRLVDAGGPGEHQDLIMDTGAVPPVLRNLPLPARDLLGSTYSSLLPYDVGGRRRLLGAQPLERRSARSLSRLEQELPFGLRLVVATQRGSWQPWGELRCEAVLPAPAGRQVRFSPHRGGGGLVPVGRLNDWRRGAYEASHVGPDA